jgi:hypothetical protein
VFSNQIALVAIFSATESLLFPHLREMWCKNRNLKDISTSGKTSCRHIKIKLDNAALEHCFSTAGTYWSSYRGWKYF